MPAMSRPALDVKGGGTSVNDEANQEEMNSLAYSKDHKAVTILYYPGVTSNGNKVNGVPRLWNNISNKLSYYHSSYQTSTLQSKPRPLPAGRYAAEKI